MVEILVWKVSTQEVIARLTGFHRRAVNCLVFSPDGQKLLSLGEDDQHSVAIYDWANQILLSATKTSSDKVYSACWKNEKEFMTVGKRSVQFFTINGKNIVSKKGIMGQLGGKAGSHLCATYQANGQLCLTGNETGEIL
jgi:WD40 repeat protein